MAGAGKQKPTEAKESAGASLESLMSSFNARIAELQQLVIARNMYPASSICELSSIDAALQGMELQVYKIKDRLREEIQAIPKAKKLIDESLKQQKRLNEMAAFVPQSLPEKATSMSQSFTKSVPLEQSEDDLNFESLTIGEPAGSKVIKKSRATAPLWYITADELNSLPQYMKGRLTLDKVNAAISDMATYADTNAQLIAAPRKKLNETTLEKALELREIAMSESVKGKHFFLESDMKGPTLKFDTTGKGILTVLRHIGRITEDRIGRHRVIILLRPA
ncbi:OLC1v1002149C1 [Oldenlandia corymbosa var. corymbosa]|uniref:SKA complex subunit 1 homolog n=1 Tax=Oldenlandia corymbosa var. corymbosa TaxID=529605 RepID=A0AAV1D9G0_OLDCO|nr:OLC1v1002149C1 [Oldenlandia corymbosa var. corymbosa]